MSTSCRKTLRIGFLLLIIAFVVKCNPIPEDDAEDRQDEIVEATEESFNHLKSENTNTTEFTVDKDDSNEHETNEHESVEEEEQEDLTSVINFSNKTEVSMENTVQLEKNSTNEDENIVNEELSENYTIDDETYPSENFEETFEELRTPLPTEHAGIEEAISTEHLEENETSEIIQRKSDAKLIVHLLGRLLNKLEVPPLEWNNYRYITALKGPDGSIYVPHHHRQSTRKHLATLLGFAEEIVTSKNALAQMDLLDTTTTTTEAETIDTEMTEQSANESITETENEDNKDNDTAIDQTENQINLIETDKEVIFTTPSVIVHTSPDLVTEEEVKAETDEVEQNEKEEEEQITDEQITHYPSSKTEEDDEQVESTEPELSDPSKETTHVEGLEDLDDDSQQQPDEDEEEYDEI